MRNKFVTKLQFFPSIIKICTRYVAYIQKNVQYRNRNKINVYIIERFKESPTHTHTHTHICSRAAEILYVAEM